ncbi:MAG: hypothetical protein WDN48_00440 [Pseudolabrys sp.]
MRVLPDGFAGLGYIVLWPVTTRDLGGPSFGASIFCYDSGPGITNYLCNSAHLLQLPPGLHMLGLLSAAFVTTRLLAHSIKRVRRVASRGKMDAAPTNVSSATVALRRLHKPPPPPPRRAVKPRTHFGLRGMPR